MAQQLTFDPSEEGNSPAVAEAEKAALAQGEALAQAELEDRARKFQQADGENEDVALIGGKFKSQDDLLNAYNELQKKLGRSHARLASYGKAMGFLKAWFSSAGWKQHSRRSRGSKSSSAPRRPPPHLTCAHCARVSASC